MALKIRLARGGSKKRPFYSVVVADSRFPRDGRFIEKIGTYDPRLPKESEQRVQINGEKAAAWIAKGAKPSDRVGRFLSKITLCLLYTSPSPRDQRGARMPSSA